LRREAFPPSALWRVRNLSGMKRPNAPSLEALLAQKLTVEDRKWYFSALESLGGSAVVGDAEASTVTYNSHIRSDESHVKEADPEELAHAVAIGLLHSAEYQYPLSAIGHEIHYAHGSKGSLSDEVDILIADPDGLPYAVLELKSASEFESGKKDAIKNQLFGTAALVGAPKLIVYATVEPKGKKPKLKCICIDYTKYKTYSSWEDDGSPSSDIFPVDYQDLDYKPHVSGGENDLDMDSTQADFRAVASSFHNEFFGEHADNTIFVNLVKCLLAKIHDERTTKTGNAYEFQVKYRNNRPESATELFARINSLYKSAYNRYIDPSSTEIDEINPKEFAEERVKTVVLAIQSISITKGAARHGDIIGAFFEEILRTGFKQDRGMYFTHDNIVRFMVEAVDLKGLTKSIWQSSNHPDNRLPYVIDPASGSGTFLLHAMGTITSAIKDDLPELVNDHDAEQFYNARMSDAQPNYWAENFIYGFDPKFIMAITAKVNMVLHGDGSAHIFKEDAFRPFARYVDARLRPISDIQRSIPRASYPHDVCESFDLVISNPPFGITIASDVKSKLSATFSLSDAIPSEGLFLERCFQLLKPRGRLAIVLPQSVFNSKDISAARLFLYRFFNIKSIVSMPRNIFIDTPTLTSLLFAQKKSAEEIAAWDTEWSSAYAGSEALVKAASRTLRRDNVQAKTAQQIAEEFLDAISPLAGPRDWILKGGRTPLVLRFNRNWSDEPGAMAADYYKDIMKSAAFDSLREKYVLSKVSERLNYKFFGFEVSDVGYKLSKRKERAKPNDLARFVGKSGRAHQNLHLADEPCGVGIDVDSPSTVLDYIAANVVWS
jgi:type I restriction enzyme M protein